MQEYNWIATDVFTVSNLLSAAECDAWIARAESTGFDDAPINSSLGPIMRKDVRNNDRVLIDDETAAERLWERAKPFVSQRFGKFAAKGLNERFRIYRYAIGQFFEWHRDGCFERANGERSFFTVLIYLNEGFAGGETSFQDLDDFSDRTVHIKPQTGLALFFEHPLLHKGEPIMSGHKYVLRTDVMYEWMP